MRTIDLLDILSKFCKKSELGHTQVKIVLPNNPQKYYGIKKITFMENKLVGQAEKYRLVIFVEE
jgi:hypothetical protein